MNTPGISQPRSRIQGEFQSSRRLFGQLIDCILNRIFSLTPRAARIRLTINSLLLLFFGLLISLNIVPLYFWRGALSTFFSGLLRFNGDLLSSGVGQFTLLARTVLLSKGFWVYLPIFYLPFLLARQYAAMYLADIFEIQRVGIARQHIRRSSFAQSNARIVIENGEVGEDYTDSPIVQIGGPGQVSVHLDSAILVEDADGRPRVIGPTGINPNRDTVGDSLQMGESEANETSYAELGGFERIRGKFNLRDHIPNPTSASDRSLDGIQVSADDVRFVYSIWRGDGEEERRRTPERPFPFRPDAIEALVYGQTCRVTPTRVEPSICTPWETGMPMMIRSELSNFISERFLVEFLASINIPEQEFALQREIDLANQARAIADPQGNPSQPPQPIEIPDFRGRDFVNRLFIEFAASFRPRNRGIELQWVGTGTWRVPDPFISERHIEAWKTSRENELRNNLFNQTLLENNTRAQETLRLIQEVPLQARQTAVGTINNQQEVIESILLDYLEQLIQARDSFRNDGLAVPQPIRTAISRIERVLRLWIFIGQEVPGRAPADDDNPPTPDELNELFNYLVNLYGGNINAANQAIQQEQARAPNENREKWIPRAIARRYIVVNRPPGFRT